MSTVATRPRRRQRPSRSICWLKRPAAGKPGMVRITVGADVDAYEVRPLPCDLEGVAVELHKQAEDAMPYHVRIAGQQSTCECLGFLAHGHCKHVDGLAVLHAAGQL